MKNLLDVVVGVDDSVDSLWKTGKQGRLPLPYLICYTVGGDAHIAPLILDFAIK